MFRRKHWRICDLYSSNRKVTTIDKNGEEITKNMFYVLQLIDSARFIESSLSNFVNHLSERLHRIKCTSECDDKKCEAYENKYKYYDCKNRI